MGREGVKKGKHRREEAGEGGRGEEKKEREETH